MNWNLEVKWDEALFLTRIAEVSSTRRVMTRIAEVSSTRRVICHWLSLRSRGAGGYVWFCMQKLRCGWHFAIHFEVPSNNSMSFFASFSDQSTVFAPSCKNFRCYHIRDVAENRDFSEKMKILKKICFCYTRPPHGNQVDDLPGAFICHWLSLRSRGAGGYVWFRMQKLRCGWRFIVHFEVPNHNSMSFFASCLDQSTLLLRRAKS